MPQAPIEGRVLVVEDDPAILELVMRILGQEGFRVDTATTSRAALRKARHARYDLAIIDLILPDTDGVILQERLCRLDPRLAGSTIFMTGFTTAGPAIDQMKSMPAEFMQKPFEPDELLAAVRRLLGTAAE